MFYSILQETPVGALLLASDGRALKHVLFFSDVHKARKVATEKGWQADESKLKTAFRQLDAYFRGTRRTFELPLAADGTAFQKRVWAALSRIPYGTTVSYGEIAAAIGQPTASRAVGLANGRNPISIIVPCHRVIGANGQLVGFGGGLKNKQVLLRLEGAIR